MANESHLWYPGATLHLINRGNRRGELFKSPLDYEAFLQKMSDLSKNEGYIIDAYCLMTNHYHLLIRTSDYPVSEWMQALQYYYARYFNKKHECDGHVFQGRYQARIINSAAYLMEVSRYIHLNPVRAAIVKRPEDYRYSSYKAYIGMEENNIVQNKDVLSLFYGPDSVAQYQKYVEEGIPVWSSNTPPSSSDFDFS